MKTLDKKPQSAQKETKVKVTKDGPYLVYGEPKINEQFIMPDEEGASSEYREGQDFSRTGTVALCRCGHTSTPPFCDGHHAKVGFKGTCTAPHTPITQNAVAFEGENFTLLDNEHYCAFARFCDASGRVWNLIQDGSVESEETAVALAHACPAGRLMIVNNQTGKTIEPHLEQQIAVLEDPAIGVSGPLYLKGSIPVEDESGQVYECRNRQTLCRCGHSGNKPFCDGSHASARFDDGQIMPRKTKA